MYAPHVSLRYGALGPVEKAMLRAAAEGEEGMEGGGGSSHGSGGVCIGGTSSPYKVLSARELTEATVPTDQIALVMTTGTDFKCWSEVARVDITTGPSRSR